MDRSREWGKRLEGYWESHLRSLLTFHTSVDELDARDGYGKASDETRAWFVMRVKDNRIMVRNS